MIALPSGLPWTRRTTLAAPCSAIVALHFLTLFAATSQL
jgi:hypothetical protein